MTINTEYYRVIRRTPSLICYWRLDDVASTVAVDRAGKYNLNGIYNGSPISDVTLISPTSGETGSFAPGSKLFGNENQNMQIPNAIPLEITGDITIEMWVFIGSPTQTCSLIGKMNSAFTYPEPYHLSLSSGKLVFSLGNNTSKTSITTTSVVTPSLPTHIVTTSFRGAMKIFVNGIENVSGSLGKQSVVDGGQPIYVGELGNNTNRFEGMMGEVALYNAAMSLATARKHFQLGRQYIYQKPYYTTHDVPSYS